MITDSKVGLTRFSVTFALPGLPTEWIAKAGYSICRSCFHIIIIVCMERGLQVFKTAFYYSQLPNRTCKDMYLQILKSIKYGEKKAVINTSDITSDQVSRVLYALDYDYPELFYVKFFGEGCEITKYSTGKTEISFRYLFSPREQKKKIDDKEKFVSYLTSHIPEDVRKNIYRKVLWLHDVLCENLTYNHNALVSGDDVVTDSYNVMGGMKDKTAVCSGISKLFQMLCEKEDVWCTYVTGITHLDQKELDNNVEGSTGRHAWNMVRIGDVYAHIDVTWDLREQGSHIPHTYYGMSDNDCQKTRMIDSNKKGIRWPICIEKNPINYYRFKKQYFCGIREIEQYVCACVKKKEKELFFRVDPGKRDPEDVCQKVIAFINQLFMNTDTIIKWRYSHSETMMTFDYSLTYRGFG